LLSVSFALIGLFCLIIGLFCLILTDCTHLALRLVQDAAVVLVMMMKCLPRIDPDLMSMMAVGKRSEH